MSVAEAITTGVFLLLKTALSIVGSLLIMLIFFRWMDGLFTRGKQRGQLHALSLKRFWCKHHVSHYTAGQHGLWALWCADCGAKVNRK